MWQHGRLSLGGGAANKPWLLAMHNTPLALPNTPPALQVGLEWHAGVNQYKPPVNGRGQPEVAGVRDGEEGGGGQKHGCGA